MVSPAPSFSASPDDDAVNSAVFSYYPDSSTRNAPPAAWDRSRPAPGPVPGRYADFPDRQDMVIQFTGSARSLRAPGDQQNRHQPRLAVITETQPQMQMLQQQQQQLPRWITDSEKGLYGGSSELADIPASDQTRISGMVACLNVFAWTAAYYLVIKQNPTLTTPAILAYILGLSFSLDFPTLSVIRHASQARSSPAHVARSGLSFSLGRSTTVGLVAVGAGAAVRKAFAASNLFDSARVSLASVAALALIAIGLVSAVSFLDYVRQIKSTIRQIPRTSPFATEETGLISPDSTHYRTTAEVGAAKEPCGESSSSLPRALDRPWRLYLLGLFFGLKSWSVPDVALVVLAAVEAPRTAPVGLISALPALYAGSKALLTSIEANRPPSPRQSASAPKPTLGALYSAASLSALASLVFAFAAAVEMARSSGFSVGKPDDLVDEIIDRIANSFFVSGLSIGGFFLAGSAIALAFYPRWIKRVNERGLGQHLANSVFAV